MENGRRWLALSATSILAYPFLLSGFHSAISSGAVTLAVMCLALAFAVPTAALVCAIRLTALGKLQAAMVAYFGVAAPTIYVFMGVLLYMAGNPVSDPVAWLMLWATVALLLQHVSNAENIPSRALLPSLRIAHGVSAAILAFYVLFHLANHLAGLAGPAQHLAIMKLGRRLYRAPFVEPLLVATMLFQIASGLLLFCRWVARPSSGFRVFQLASGFYLSFFILGHMNSVFVFARRYLKIETDWNFATGAPTGLISDSWNIRLIPHYWLGVFFVLAHMASGLRIVLEAHGFDRALAGRAWAGGLVTSAVIATAIIVGMCGVRI